jgi:hypothetical protein
MSVTAIRLYDKNGFRAKVDYSLIQRIEIVEEIDFGLGASGAPALKSPTRDISCEAISLCGTGADCVTFLCGTYSLMISTGDIRWASWNISH